MRGSSGEGSLCREVRLAGDGPLRGTPRSLPFVACLRLTLRWVFLYRILNVHTSPAFRPLPVRAFRVSPDGDAITVRRGSAGAYSATLGPGRRFCGWHRCQSGRSPWPSTCERLGIAERPRDRWLTPTPASGDVRRVPTVRSASHVQFSMNKLEALGRPRQAGTCGPLCSRPCLAVTT